MSAMAPSAEGAARRTVAKKMGIKPERFRTQVTPARTVAAPHAAAVDTRGGAVLPGGAGVTAACPGGRRLRREPQSPRWRCGSTGADCTDC